MPSMLYNLVPDTRQEVRHRVRIPDVEVRGRGVPRHRTVIINVSAIGVRIVTTLELQVGKRIHLAFNHRGVDYYLIGTVRFVREMPRGMPPGPRRFASGVEIEEVAQGSLTDLMPAS